MVSRGRTSGGLRLLALGRFPLLRDASRHVLHRLGYGQPKPIAGLPESLNAELIDALCRERGKGRLKRCSHVHLSGWKSLGAYRIELLTENGERWMLIYKDECYRTDVIPALDGLPVLPGPPEATILRMRDSALSPFLPELISFRELQPGRHFQFLLEDLSQDYELLRPKKIDHVEAARTLLRLQSAMQASFRGRPLEGLIYYDRSYSERLLDYARSSLASYAARVTDGPVTSVVDRWEVIESVHQRDEFYDDALPVLIHGDYNASNIHVPRARGNQLKIVDWEWAGVGVAHADLAALAKSVPREDAPALLQVIIDNDRRFSPEQHRRVFAWCQLERGLLDAAFLAHQELATNRSVSWLQSAINRAASGVLYALESLKRGSQIRS